MLINKLLFIIKGLRTIVFIFIVISTTFRLTCPPAFFRCSSNREPSQNFELRPLLNPQWITCSDSVGHNRVQVLSIPVLLLVGSQDWNCNLQMIVSLEALGTVTLCVNSEWIFGTYKLNVLIWLGLLLLCMIFYLCSYSDFFPEITIKMTTRVQKPLMIKIIKLRLRNLDNQ